MTKILIYDCEIINCIPPKDKSQKSSNLSYCLGWRDFKNMGISVIGTWRNYATMNPFGTYEAFVNADNIIPCSTVDSLLRFRALIQNADEIIGFNSISFDDNLVRANGIKIQTTEDFLQTIRVASGQPSKYFKGKTRKGYALKEIAEANLRINKTLSGESAAIEWQKGNQKKVVNYCLQDVRILRELYFKFNGQKSFSREGLIDPTTSKRLTRSDLK